jgi:biotin carboxyl carrier protein
MHKPTPPHPASPPPGAPPPPPPGPPAPAPPPTPTPRPTTPSQGDTIKKGQTVAYVEQLGTFVAIEAPQAGEVARFLLNEGDAVEYGQDVLELAPFFGGHIIGDSKHA